ncbi:Thioredoxin reductase 1 [Platanthera guangdongensis]|uniref:Thioredoxin reductase 1 n=1 Tax=Platanthera guangdongensis TaxID=2320717 RepID=A0ABR2LXJ7_9ASPA
MTTHSHRDRAAPIFQNRTIAVVGDGDLVMEEAKYLTKYWSRIFIVHQMDTFRASKIMRPLSNPKIDVPWNSQVLEAYGENEGGLFFAIEHDPATKFLGDSWS